MILVAFAMVLTIAQCKKNEETNPSETVTIILDAKKSNNSRVDVNTATGTVDFEAGDKVYVGSGGKYVGFLTHNGTNFVGNITNPTEGQPLQFYFLGNVTPAETLTAGTTESCSVVISDQTEHLPVISYAASYENYVSGVTTYTAHLLNKCALVKFNVTTPSNSPICITGMHNKVTVDFTQNTVTPGIDGDGVIMLPEGSGENVEKWAILLPQEIVEVGLSGSVYSEDGNYIGIRPEIPTIIENGYLADGVGIMVNNCLSPVGAINGLFSVSPSQKVYFSKGNLQYRASVNVWRFADNQWDFVGSTECINGEPGGGTVSGSSNHLISPTYDGWIDLFGYNTGENPTETGSSTNLYYYNNGWGASNISISNGGNEANLWRGLTYDEWNFLLFIRTPMSGIRYAKAIVNEVNGVILLPDNWNENTYSLNDVNTDNTSFSANVIDADTWSYTMESNGAVFLPAAGYRCALINEYGGYWSETIYNSYHTYAYGLSFNETMLVLEAVPLIRGISVRLVQDY